ncbi:MAG TPA: HAMP domain-containing sensor histidine kinase [Vicinamibacterales bacterium]|jgi:signal transduction histidine kinase
MIESRDHGSRLLSLAVHELRTPLAVTSGYLRLLLRHFGDNLTDQQRKLVQESDKSCGLMAGLLDELSELAHFDEVQARSHPTPIAIGALLNEVAAGIAEGRDRGVRLAVCALVPDVAVVADPARLGTALGTLLTAVLRERATTGTVVAACHVTQREDTSRDVVIVIGDEATADSLPATHNEPSPSFDDLRGGLGFRLVLAARVIAALGGHMASPIATPGRLGIVVSLPAAPDSPTAA